MDKISIEPFNRLVKLAARAFYDDDITTKGENQPKIGRSDNRGIAVVVLDALTRRQWVREEDLAKVLKLHSKQLRRTLRFLEEEKMITRDHRKETAKGVKIYNAAVAATADGRHSGREGDDKIKLHTHSYCCLDYAQIYDVVRYRLHRMRKMLKDELDNKNTVQEYSCPNCRRRYTALDACRLVSMEDDYFHCENCNGELVAESEKLTAQEVGDRDDNARRGRRDKLEAMLKKMEAQLKPLTDQLNRVKDLPVPEFGTLLAWEAQANTARANRDLNGDDPSKSSPFLGPTPMPNLEDTKVEVNIDEAIKSETSTPMKVLPPWMIREGMVLTKEQRGEVKEEAMADSTKTSVKLSDDKKSTTENNDVKSYQDEYLKAYYEAMLKRQREQEAANRDAEFPVSDVSNGASSTTERQVGMKSKRDEEDDGDDVEWEEAAPAGTANGQFKVNDLNVEADALVDDDNNDDDDDGLDWEEG
ncbi:OLC1v1014276C1 [Oldenlandia corymbosa var. corymbosa]|uniref:OLC1v1014276C1 n=1 Tax=Oldenlandia corymbosa var. corymbosa TaxID=529605 RepID=A0AAV1E0N9_OLDCO|nr:OLC1v1014276C1 [Oldenlandia corymbosa var. corymbosa]